MSKDSELNDEDPAVPTDLLEIHISLEETGLSPEEFKEAFG